jgi:2-haloalkanoic acid dehalogenase type II
MPVRPYDVLTFDCYGTLIDWERGISESIAAAARADGIEADREQILAIHAEVEPQIQSDTYLSYREVLADVALAVARRLEWPLKPERARFLPDGLPGWRVFPDTNPALQRLKQQGYRLGILSNVDDDLLAGTRLQFSVDLDLVVTAEQVRSYKPARQHFDRARELIGDARWLHVAQSYFHDIEPACALGLPVVWVNRKREEPCGAARPTAEVGDLTELVAWLETQG